MKFLCVDLSDLSTITPAVEHFLREEKRLDVLVNNAGVSLVAVDYGLPGIFS